VYASDRTDRRALPQMPCPDVHPLPRLAPRPTSSPASAVRPRLNVGASNAAGMAKEAARPPSTKPPLKTKRHTSGVPLNIPLQAVEWFGVEWVAQKVRCMWLVTGG
jgi:hypothetical protein